MFMASFEAIKLCLECNDHIRLCHPPLKMNEWLFLLHSFIYFADITLLKENFYFKDDES